MRRPCSILAALIVAGCTPSAPPPKTAAAEPPAPPPPRAEVQVPAAKPAPEPPQHVPAPAPPKPAAPAPKPPPAPVAKAPPAPPQVQKAAPPPAPPAPAPVAAAPSMDLKSLEQRLKDTDAIGLMTKLSLKNQVDDLVGRFKSFHAGQRPPTLDQLKPAFDLLLMKVLSLLQDKDPALAKDINGSRGALWTVLADPAKFSRLD